jgi:hypothetical protein
MVVENSVETNEHHIPTLILLIIKEVWSSSSSKEHLKISLDTDILYLSLYQAYLIEEYGQ